MARKTKGFDAKRVKKRATFVQHVFTCYDLYTMAWGGIEPPTQGFSIHGFETRQIRKERSEGLARLYELETLGRKIGLITGEKARGPKPKGLKGEA